MTRLYIAEKPSLGRAIAAVIGVKTPGKTQIDCKNGDVVTWVRGHFLGLKEPHEYDIKLKQWREQDLPFIPDKFEKKPTTSDANATAQLKAVLKLLKSKDYDEIINAGDAGREGQLLVDEVIEYSGTKTKVGRIWLLAMDDSSIKKAIENIQPNTLPKYANLSTAGEARSRADWMVGLNLTRATTLRARAHGMNNLISVGRVQSPALAIVVKRDDLIDNFKATNYFTPAIECDAGGTRFLANWVPINTDTPDFDPENRLLSEDFAKALLSGHSTATVKSAEKKRKSIEPPLPHALSTLRKVASNKYGFSAKKTLDIVQKLYDDKFVSYPRTPSQKIPMEMHADSAGILNSLSKRYDSAKSADPSIKSKAWDKNHTEDHYAIIPLGPIPKSLGPDEEKIFNIICESFIQLFYPPQITETYTILLETTAGGLQSWKASVTSTVEAGWRAVAGLPDSEKSLPQLTSGTELQVVGGDVQPKKTKPLPRFNDGTLIEAMKTVHKDITDPDLKAQLKDSKGIGTEATHGSIIETLLNRKYIKRVGKYLESTDLGKEVDSILPESLKDPVMTAMWEDYLGMIASGEADVLTFYNQIEESVKSMTEFALTANYAGREVHTCPECSANLVRIESKNKKGSYFWACTGSREHPLLSDMEGKPGEPFKTKAA